MRRTAFSAACVTFAACSFSQTESYDFFSQARYPGPVKVPGVDLYRVEQEGGPHAEGYRRRVVWWWPRRGVDIIQVKKGMPFRTWTLRNRTMSPATCAVSPELGTEELTRRLPSWLPRRFKAHLIGFRGIGNLCGDPFGFRRYWCPAVVLRLPDGRKRCFLRGSFIEDDEHYILKVYTEAMKRLRASLKAVRYELSPGTATAWPNSAEPGQPGTMRTESQHFVWVSGSQQAPNESFSPWVNHTAPEKARRYREGAVAFAEDMWAYQEHAGVLMPYWDRERQYKYEITVCGTYVNGYRWIGGYAGGGYGGCGIKHAGGGPWSLGLAHEWGHGLPLQSKVDGGGGEILADACQVIVDPARTEKFSNNVRRPWRTCIHGSYATGLFYAVMGDDPNWGYAMAITLPVAETEPSIFHTLARLGEARGLFENGVRGVGDMVGEFSARLAEFDCELQDSLKREFISVKRNYLEAVDRKAGLYRIPSSEAPEAFGANIIRLVPKKGPNAPRAITVDFRGFYDPATYADWRACIVAVGADGRARYSPLWNKGPMSMELGPGDRRVYLTVAATPSALPVPPGGRGIGPLLDGRHAYRYPYEVKLSGCRPGTPHNMPSDIDDYELTCLGQFRRRDTGGLCVIPPPGDSAEADRLRSTLPRLRSTLARFTEKIERLIASGAIQTGSWWYARRFAPNLTFLKNYLNWMLAGIEGHRHPNGGGWVASGATVAPTAYVGPNAMVLDGAKVLDHAAVEDFSVVRGPGAVLSGHAKVMGQAYVQGKVTIGGYTRVLHPIVAQDKEVIPNEVPLRPFQDPAEDGYLWAYYACDRPEAEVFEDYFKYRTHWGICWQFYVLNLNGHLYGRPQFVVEGPHRGFRFDGRTQYAEASPVLADLGQITIEVALKWEGGAQQAIFDFGTSPENRFVLTPQGPSGNAELIITSAGHTERLVAPSPLPEDRWVECRCEIDGAKVALWINNRKVAEKPSSFRPAQVYPPGKEKRNFVAAYRDGRGKFKGTLDYLRVYYKVYGDFSSRPPPRRHAPRRVSREFIDSCRRECCGSDLRQQIIDAKLRPLYAYYEQIGREVEKRIREIEKGSPQLEAAQRRRDEIRRRLEKRRAELRAEFEKLPETVETHRRRRALEEELRACQKRRNDLMEDLRRVCREQHKALVETEEKHLTQLKERRLQVEAKLKQLEDSLRAVAQKKAPDDRDRQDLLFAELRYKNQEYLQARYLREQTRAEEGRIEAARSERFQKAARAHPELATLDRRITALRRRIERLRTDPRNFLERRLGDLRKELAQAEVQVGKAFAESIAPYRLEYDYLYGRA